MQLTFAILLLFIVPSVGSLQCYVCNSNEDAGCADGDDLKRFVQTCKETAQPYCRKIDQTVNGQSSVVRVCGSKSGSKSCYKTSGINNANVCSCNADLCNNAMNFHRQTLIPSLIVLAISMFLPR